MLELEKNGNDVGISFVIKSLEGCYQEHRDEFD